LIKSILASLTGYGSDRSVLEASIALARIDKGHIECHHAGIAAQEAAAMVQFSAPERPLDMEKVSRQLAREERERLAHAKSVAAEVFARHGVSESAPSAGALTASFRAVESLRNETLHEARFHDVTVMGRDAELARERIESVLLGSGRPLLLAPPKPQSGLGHSVAIAWKAGPESARAVAAALPILAGAGKVFILTVLEHRGADGEDRLSAQRLADYLGRHGVKAEIVVEEAGAPAAQAVKQMAYACDADLLVMGGYGHGRMREWVFGGVTREILAGCALPVLICA